MKVAALEPRPREHARRPVLRHQARRPGRRPRPARAHATRSSSSTRCTVSSAVAAVSASQERHRRRVRLIACHALGTFGDTAARPTLHVHLAERLERPRARHGEHRASQMLTDARAVTLAVTSVRSLRLATALALGGAATLALLPASCTTEEPPNETYFDADDRADPHDVVRPHEHRRRLPRRRREGQRVRQPGPLELRGHQRTARSAPELRAVRAAVAPRKNIPRSRSRSQFYDGRPRSASRRTSSTPADRSSTRPRARYQVLARWIENGATENNAGPPPASTYRLPCTDTIGDGARASTRDADRPDDLGLRDLQEPGQPALPEHVRGGQLPRDDGERPLPHVREHAAGDPLELLRGAATTSRRRPSRASFSAGRSTGGRAARSTRGASSSSRRATRLPGAPRLGDGARAAVLARPAPAAHEPTPADPTRAPGFSFFAHRVQPILAKKGCMMPQCHSAAMFHDYRLRGGSAGSFSLSATERNYTLSIAQLAFESDDVMASRLVRKNLFRPELSLSGQQVGIAHRGGPLFEDFGSTRTARSARAAPGRTAGRTTTTTTDRHDPRALHDPRVAPARARGPEPARRVGDRLREPDDPARRRIGRRTSTSSPAAPAPPRARRSTSTDGRVTLGTDTVMNTACGLDPGERRRPPAERLVGRDDDRVRGAQQRERPARDLHDERDGTNCAQHAAIDAGPTTGNGLLEPQLRPRLQPSGLDGTRASSSRRRAGTSSTTADVYDYTGPQRTPADPTKPNANLYVSSPTRPAPAAPSAIRQHTFLLNMERYPTFMQDGRLDLHDREARAGVLRARAPAAEPRRGRLPPALRAARQHRLRPGARAGGARGQELRGDLQRPGDAARRRDARRLQPLDRGRLHEHEPGRLPGRPERHQPGLAASPEPSFFLSSLTFPDASVSGHAGQATTGSTRTRRRCRTATCS